MKNIRCVENPCIVLYCSQSFVSPLAANKYLGEDSVETDVILIVSSVKTNMVLRSAYFVKF